jgi:hypothetical protein
LEKKKNLEISQLKQHIQASQSLVVIEEDEDKKRWKNKENYKKLVGKVMELHIKKKEFKQQKTICRLEE